MEQYRLPWDEILHLTNGLDINGFPLSAGGLTIDRVTKEKKMEEVSNVLFENAVIGVEMSGGCVTVTADFQKGEERSFLMTDKLARNWMQNLANPEYDDQILSVTIAPILLEGTFFFVMTNLVFYDSYRTENGSRVIFAFDNNETIPVITDEIDIQQMILNAERELNKELNELRAEVAEIEAEERAIRESNIYEQQLLERMSTVTFDHGEDEFVVDNPNIRISKNKEGEE